MKYKAKKTKNGKWAVYTGKKYFTETICDSENETIIMACEMSAQWYQHQIYKCNSKWEKTREKEGIENGIHDWGDVLC